MGLYSTSVGKMKHLQRIGASVLDIIKTFLLLCPYIYNPSLHEFFISSVLERQPKIGFNRLPTRRRDAHRKLF